MKTEAVQQRQKTITIRTPEGIAFPMLLADPVTRFLAVVIDGICISIIGTVLGYATSLAGLISFDVATALSTVLSFIIAIFYPIVLEWKWRGQTVGKRVFRIRVMDEQGMKLLPSQIVIRNLLRAVDILPGFYLVGGLCALLTVKGQRLGDIAGSTVVIKHPKIDQPDLDEILPDKYNSFRQYPHLAARLKQYVTPGEAGLAVRALMRRKTLDPQARLELFAELAGHFKSVAQFPAEATDGLSDERYVRNVVDILYR